MESGKMASPKSRQKDAQMMAQILKDGGITEHEPAVINQLLEYAFRYVTTILDDAKISSSHAEKATVDADDRFLIRYRKAKKSNPFAINQAIFRLTPDRYCLTAPNYRLKYLQRKASTSAGRVTVLRLSVGSVTSRPSTPTLGTPTPQTMSVSTKVGTPMSLMGAKVYSTDVCTSQSPSVKASIPCKSLQHSAVQNVLINPSLIGPKTFLLPLIWGHHKILPMNHQIMFLRYLLLGRNMDSLMNTEPERRIYQQVPISSGLKRK
ncbi:LOW QUALITY PROTEIN: Transcription initiation factor TFIID subunit 9, partial [Plecturocebus cupreus]